MKKISTFLILLMVLSAGSTLFAQIRINEFLASNDASFPGPQGDYPDWIELYNAGAEAVDIGGYWICDDLNEPDKRYQIPATNPEITTIEPGGFLLIVANDNTAAGVLNVDFKLSGSGEHIGLWLPDKTTVVDTLTYGAQTTDVSMGLSPNAGQWWYFFTTPTPGAANPDYTGIDTPQGFVFKPASPNPCSSSTTLEFGLHDTSPVLVALYDLTGNRVLILTNKTYRAGYYNLVLNTSELGNGIYFCRLSTNNGVSTQRIIVSR